MGDAGAYGHHMAHAFMAGNERRVGLDRPVAFHGVQVGMADAAGLDLHQQLARAGSGHRDFLDGQRLAERPGHGGFHGLVHRILRCVVDISIVGRLATDGHDMDQDAGVGDGAGSALAAAVSIVVHWTAGVPA